LILLTPSAGSSHERRNDPLFDARTAAAAGTDIDPYTLVLWRVLPGRRELFLDCWRALIAQLQQLERPPLMGSLVESLVDDHLFYSIASWDLMRDITSMRQHPECRRLVAELQALCDLSAGGTYRGVLSLDTSRHN